MKGFRQSLWLTLAALTLGVLGLFASPASHAAGSTFDHFTTGFDLIGQHKQVACESCHVGGIFKGTPTDCFSCHAAGSRIGATSKPTNHILSSNDCAACHTPYGWRPVAKFNHLNVLGSCSSCHNGVQSVGKPSNHIPTTAECSTCHLVQLPWKAAHYDHANITDNCARCHDNVHAPGKPPTHVPTTNACETCHLWKQPLSANFVTFADTPMNHVGITNNCQSCHETGMSWYGQPPTVTRPTLAQDPNHPSATSPNGADCSNCHTGFNVGDFNKGNKPANHIPTKAGVACVACHDLTDLTKMGSLTAIHQNAPSSTTNCQACHGTNSSYFDLPAIGFHIVGLQGLNHMPTTVSCEVCHAGPGSSFPAVPVADGAKFSGSLMNHQGVTTCDGCHGSQVTSGSFVGISNIIAMPPTGTAPGGPTLHVPSNNSCETCHARSVPPGYVAANATAPVPGSRFGVAFLPNTDEIHNGMKSGCTACHERDSNWMGMNNYPISPTVFVVTTQYTGFLTRPYASATQFSIVDAAHPADKDCVLCHGTNFKFFDSQVKPDNHIPTAASATCANCHNVGDFAQMPSISNIHQYAPSQTTNCVQCHGTSQAATYAIPAIGFKITTMAQIAGGAAVKHLTTSQSCEVCHVGAGSSVPTTVQDTSKFSGSLMNHANVTTCVECHGPAVQATSFTGIGKVIIMPATTPAGSASAHIPSGNACENCHVLPSPAGPMPASATLPVPGSQFGNLMTSGQIHTGVTQNCQSCHEGSYQWMGMSKYPISPTTLSTDPNAQYKGFQTRPGATAGTFMIKDAAHPTTGDCETCHGSNFDYFDGVVKPDNHIPYKSGTSCSSCHTTSNFATMPTISNIHKYAESTTTNCVQCHGTTQAATFAIPAANFTITTMAKIANGASVKHVPTTQACEICHVGTGSSVATTVADTSKFSGSKFNHSGSSTCVECHGSTITGTSFTGITKIIVMPPTTPAGAATAHIPSSTACEACHAGSAPSGQIAANATVTAPGTKFATPVPTTAQIHAGVTTNCQSCHAAPYAWMGMSKYPITPATLSTNTSTQYTGFQTRPGATAGTYIVKDANHPATGDCQTCHGGNINYFSGNIKPTNHIPYLSTALCTNCHTNTDFSVMPAIGAIHQYAQSQTSNCVQCHGTTQAAGFAIPAANFTITTMAKIAGGGSVTHLPTSLSCEVCHVGAGSSIQGTVADTSKFSASKMNHAGSTTCVGCHGPAVNSTSFTGIAKVIVMPATSPAGVSSHIPSSTSCETCHAGPSGLIAASATATVPGSLFGNMPTTAQIHTNITSGCVNCHEAPNVWMGMQKYPISPTTVSSNSATQYIGFQTRPGPTAGTYIVKDAAHPTTGDCNSCHGSNTNYFVASGMPSNHIPILAGAACATCHTTAGNFDVYTSNMTTLHSAVSTACSTCHADGKGPFAGVSSFKLIQMSTRGTHIPITNAGVAVECSGCHKTVTAFSGTIMSHAAIGDSATSAAGNACDACHEFGYKTKFYGVTINFTRDSSKHYICGAAGTPTAPNTQICSGGGSDCQTGCHDHYGTTGKRMGNFNTYKQQKRPVAASPTRAAPPSRGVVNGRLGERASGIDRATGTGVGSGAAFSHADAQPGSCSSCHNGGRATGPGASHPKTTSACADCHSKVAWSPVMRVDHADVLGTCSSCHNGKTAIGKPAGHIASGMDCDRCHTTSAWKPAAFDHGGVIPGTCATCHNGLQAVNKGLRHVVTQESCDTCHYVLGWTPVKPPMAPLRRVIPPRTPGPPRTHQTPMTAPRIPQ
jgi:hypothetical protein